MFTDIDMINESLDDIYVKYYQNSPLGHLDRDEFDDTIRIDPTFSPEKDNLGKYGKWLLKLRIENDRDFNPTEIQELQDQLNIFNQHKIGYSVTDRDINRLKSLQDLIDINSKYDAKNSTPELIKASTFPGLEIVGQDNDWEIYHPTTYEASKYIRGDNAVWCTGRANDRSYFDSYNKDRILIVFINKHDRNEKYQGAFYKQGFGCSEFAGARNDHKDFSRFLSEHPEIKQILLNSKYKKIASFYDDRLRNTNNFIDSNIDENGYFKLTKQNTDEVLVRFHGMSLDALPIDRRLTTEKLKELPGFSIESSNLLPRLGSFMNFFFPGTGLSPLKEKNLRLPAEDDFGDISNMIPILMFPNKIEISKKSKFKCFKIQIKQLKDKLVWY